MGKTRSNFALIIRHLKKPKKADFRKSRCLKQENHFLRPFLGPRIECGVTSLHRSSRHRYRRRFLTVDGNYCLNTAEAVDYSVIPRYDAESRNARKSAVTGPRIMCGVTCRAEAVDIGTIMKKNFFEKVSVSIPPKQ